MNKKILVIGPGKRTRGGITSVIKAHSQTDTWKKWNCKWIESYRDSSNLVKIFYFLKGYSFFLLNLYGSTLVHIHLSEPMSAKRKWFFFKTAKAFKKPVILHFHAFSSETTLFGSKAKLYENMFNKADGIVALSGFWKNKINQITKRPYKIYVLYNPCPAVKIIPAIERQKKILFAGTLNERKGYVDLMVAFARIAKKHKDWKVVFAGNGELGKAKHLAQELGIQNQIILTGWVSDRAKDEIFNSAAFFCLPSYAEGFPMGVLDAWAFGLPVITTPVGGLPDILEHGKNALVFEPGDIISLSKNIEKLITDSELHQKIARASKNLAMTTFNIRTIERELDGIYSELK